MYCENSNMDFDKVAKNKLLRVGRQNRDNTLPHEDTMIAL
jgi:hypothetical protein